MGAEVTTEATQLEWPTGLFALSHSSVPVPPDDPVYGAERPNPAAMIYLGRLGLQGEEGLLAVPAASLARLRFDPFFEYLERRTMSFTNLTESGSVPGGTER